jgi:hypothetical protein
MLLISSKQLVQILRQLPKIAAFRNRFVDISQILHLSKSLKALNQRGMLKILNQGTLITNRAHFFFQFAFKLSLLRFQRSKIIT